MKKQNYTTCTQNDAWTHVSLSRYLQIYCKKIWRKVWFLKFWVRKTATKKKLKKVIGLIKDELDGK